MGSSQEEVRNKDGVKDRKFGRYGGTSTGTEAVSLCADLQGSSGRVCEQGWGACVEGALPLQEGFSFPPSHTTVLQRESQERLEWEQDR